MPTPVEIAAGLSDHEQRDLANLAGLECEFSGMHNEGWAKLGLCRLTGVGRWARLTDLGREVAKALSDA